jgi:hypothetical protein
MAKNKSPSLVISIAMMMCRCDTARIAQHGRSRATLDATLDAAIGQVFAPYQSSCGVLIHSLQS